MAWLPGIAVSVVVTLFAFPPYPLGPLMLVGLVPLFVALDRAPTARAAFLRALTYVFIGNAILCAWVAFAVREFARLPVPVAWGSVVGLSLLEQLAWPLLAAARFFVHRRLGVRPVLWTPACAYVLESLLPKVFPNTMGNVFFSTPWLAQAADLAGVTGLTAVIVASNEWIASRLDRARPVESRPRHALATILLVAGTLTYGAVRYSQVHATAPRRTLKVSVVQPNMNVSQLLREVSDKETTRRGAYVRLEGLSRRALQDHPSLVIWPETAFPGGYQPKGMPTVGERLVAAMGVDPSDRLSRDFDAFVAGSGVPFLFGSRWGDSDERRNSLFLLGPDGRADRYDKTKLLLLGEAMPLASVFPWLSAWASSHGGTTYLPGDGARTFEVDGVRLGPMICYEGLYAGYVRDIVNGGAEVLVNGTNDSWFGPGREPWLHLYLTAFRAIETRRPLVRATSTGISAVVDIDGRILASKGLGREGVTTVDVPVYPAIGSPYLTFGPAWIVLALGWTLWPLRRLSAARKNRKP